MQNNKTKKIMKSELLVYIYISILTIAKSIGLSSSNKEYYVLFLCGLVLAIFKIFNDKLRKHEIIIVLFGLIIGAFALYFGKETTILFTCLILLCLKNIEVRKIIKLMFWIKLIIFVVVIALTFAGILDNNSIMVWRNGTYIERFSFIYGHPNSAQLNLSLIIFLWIYLYYNKISIFNITILEIVNYIFYNLTLSRTGFLITAFFLVFSYIYKNSERIRKISSRVSKNIFIYLTIFTIAIGLLYGSGKIPLLNTINDFTSGRIYYINYILKNVDIPIIGKSSYNNIMIDNGFISVLYNGGIFAMIWFLYLSTKTSHLLHKNKMYKEILITIILLTYSLAESFYLNIILNFSLFFFAYYIYSNEKRGI